MYFLPILVAVIVNFLVISGRRHTNNRGGENNTQPHIVVILGDDMGWNDFGYHGSNQIPTPNIDALGYNGVFLNRFYTQQTCTPSRAALLTGNYPIRLGFQGYPMAAGEDESLPANMPTMAEKLKDLGYKTHMVGKWHLGASTRNHTPTGRGFDTHFGYWNGFVGYFNYVCSQGVPHLKEKVWLGFDLHENFKDKWEYVGKYATDVFTEKSLEVIENHSGKEPMFLYLAHLAGHTGWDGYELGVKNITETNRKFGYVKDLSRRNYTEIISQVDKSIGMIVEKLKKKNMLENSIILFFSDNGGQTTGEYANTASGFPFRGQKYTLFEGGVRGSAVLYSPLLTKKRYINNNLIHITDWLPTFYHVGGGNVSSLGTIDGINQWNVISKNISSSRNEILLNVDEVHNYSGLIGQGGRFKLINGSHNGSIYDGFYGASGRDKINPSYDFESVLSSPVNIAIQSLRGSKPLRRLKIRTLREKLDISGCRNASTTVNCDKYCLFDLHYDPCETKNILEEKSSVAESVVIELIDKLASYRAELIPQDPLHPVDINANPIRFNGSWCTWKDDEMCTKTF